MISKDPFIGYIRTFLKNDENAISCIEEYLNCQVKDYQTLAQPMNTWDVDHPEQHYFAMTNALITLQDNQKAIAKIVYFSEKDLFTTWSKAITKIGQNLMIKGLSMTNEEIKQATLYPIYAIAITNFESPPVIVSVRGVMDEDGNKIHTDLFPDSRSSQIAYVNLTSHI